MSKYLAILRKHVAKRQQQADLERQSREATRVAMEAAFAPFREVWDQLRDADVKYWDARHKRSSYMYQSYPDRCYLYGYGPNTDVIFTVTSDLVFEAQLDPPNPQTSNRFRSTDVADLIDVLIEMLSSIVTEVPDAR